MSKKDRLDALVLASGLADDLRTARGLIMSGKVLVDDAVCTKAGVTFSVDARVRVRGRQLSYASRGGYKLAAALESFGVDVEERIVLDAGASTGGFTDCLLQCGASRVYAVDVGYGQLRGKLATDPRVVNMERTNIGDVERDSLDPPISLAVADLSNLSLRTAIPVIADLFVSTVEIIVLVKPLFEGLDRADMDTPDALAETLRAMARDLQEVGFGWRRLIASPVRGGRSSVEFLAHVFKGLSDESQIESAITTIPADDVLY